MKKDIAEKWVKALRSGQYKQTIGALKDENGYCCLGILCEISGLSYFDERNTYLGQHCVLPIAVMHYSGLNKDNGGLLGSHTLAGHNDSGVPFEQIANIIEENWEKL